MKKLFIALLLLLSAGVKAQTFNFDCSEDGCTAADFSIVVIAGVHASFHKSDDITTTASITTVSDDHPTGIEGSLDSFYVGTEPTDYITGVFRNTDVIFERGDYIVIHQPARPEIDLQDVYTLATVGVVHYDAIEYSIITENGYRFDRQVEIHRVHQ